MAHQIEPLERRERRQYVDYLVNEIREAIASRAIDGTSSLRGHRIDELELELEGMRRHLRRTLVAALGRQDGEALEASLFAGDLAHWLSELKELKVDRIARRAVDIHPLVVDARRMLPQIEAARREAARRWRAESEAAEAAREAEIQRRVREESPRRLERADVGDLLKQIDYAGPLQGPVSVSFRAALKLGLITDLEYELARRAYGPDFDFYD